MVTIPPFSRFYKCELREFQKDFQKTYSAILNMLQIAVTLRIKIKVY